MHARFAVAHQPRDDQRRAGAKIACKDVRAAQGFDALDAGDALGDRDARAELAKLLDVIETALKDVFGDDEELRAKFEVLKSVLYGRTRITLLTPIK